MKNTMQIDLAKSPRKFNLLWLSGAPFLATGFATVARAILKSLHATNLFDITVLGINHLGDYYNQKEFPYKVYRAQLQPGDDLYGRTRLFEFLKTDMFDLLFTLYDPFIIAPMAEQIRQMQGISKRKFKWISYFPVDATQRKEWVDEGIMKCDYPVAYTQYGKDEFIKQNPEAAKKTRVIYHGVDTDDYFPVGPNTVREFKRRYFQRSPVDDSTFLLVNVGRNQFRKDFATTLRAYKKFKKIVPNAYLYLHTKESDLGGSIMQKARTIGLKPGRDFSLPGNFSEFMGVPRHVLNMIYNSADVVTSTNVGEGFGLATIEGMATKTLCVMPDNSATSEILADGRGLLVKSGATPGEWVNYGAVDLDRMRPVTNIDDLVKKWKWAYDHPEDKKAIEEKAYNWAKAHTWEKVNVAWVELFKEAIIKLMNERLQPQATVTPVKGRMQFKKGKK